MDYLLVIKQKGEGCDYSIECGTAVKRFQVGNLQAARVAARQYIIGDGEEESGFYGDRALEGATLFEIGQSVVLPLTDWYWQSALQLKDQAVAARESEDRALYERLKEKFEGGDR